MKLTRLRIDRFRAIRSADIRIGDELALVGQNSSGKTSVLRALNAFFNFEDERQAFETGQHVFRSSAVAIIDVTFSNTPDACPIPRVSPSGDLVRARLRYKREPLWEIYVDRDWQKAPQDFQEQLHRFISYAFIPLRRDHHVAGWGPEGLMERVIEASVNHGRQRDHITPKIKGLTQAIKNQSLDTLVKQLRKKTPLNGTFEYVLKYEEAPDYSVLLRDLTLHVTEGSQSVRLADSGSGTQSMAVFALYSYLAELENSTYILGFEEPEQNLHPQAQMQLLKNLRGLGLQILFTTHSSTMIDALDHEQVVLCRRAQASRRDVEMTISQLPEDFFLANGMNRESYYKFHRRRNSEFFFADFVVVTESPVDAMVVRHLMSDGHGDLEALNMTILPLDGVTNIDFVYHLLKSLEIEAAFVVDKDYFLPYKNDEVKLSRNNHGFPQYRREFKRDCLIKEIIPKETERIALLDYFWTNPSRAASMLASANFYCFRWSLEIDLVAAPVARATMADICQIHDPDKRTSEELLTQRQNKIKKQEVVGPVLAKLGAKNLPSSYKLLRRDLPTKAKLAAR
ncbi:ATP-dependent endonuclease [Pseudarthrobacter sp. B4EP4b]|uniref:ATP-dependent nuclease n=1 Tax=Pseudarthrobacter sp. B4EP4b TaxID=2590664 RepID=UPI0011523C9A|nr:AAA family ATPase [Pseudarthrobacter sp. B4EP4b]